MSAESEDIHEQKRVCGDLACRCTVMKVSNCMKNGVFQSIERKCSIWLCEGSFCGINKRRKSNSLLSVTIDRTRLKRRSLKNAVIKTYNWLKSCDLMPQNVESITKAQVKSHRQIMEVFIPYNKELFDLFYIWITKLLLNVSFMNWLQALKRKEIRGIFKKLMLVL